MRPTTLRHWLCLLLMLPLLAAAQTVTVLYKRESDQSLVRTETAVQSALLSVERELIDRGWEVIQPDAKTYTVLDKAPGTVVTFSPDAGLTLLMDAVKAVRPNQGTDNSFAEVRLRARLFHGRRILASLTGNGQIGFRIGSEDKAFESAADRAVRQLIGQLMSRLEDATTEEPAPAPAPAPVTDSSPLPSGGKKWALLIGISDFSNVRRLNPKAGVPDLNATPDVVLIRKTLLEMGTPDSQIRVLIDKAATTGAIRSALQELNSKSAPDDQVLFYIASHGLPKQEGISGFGYPVTYDTRFSDKNSIIDFEEIQIALKNLPAQQILWLADTCHSGGATTGMPVVEISKRSVLLKSATTNLSTRSAVAGIGPKNMVVLSSAKEDQVALEDNGNGLFTLKLAQGIRKAGKGESIYRIFKEHVEVQVPARSQELEAGYRQQPVFAKSGKGEGLSF